MLRTCLVCLLTLALSASVALADVPTLINYQGKLNDANGKPVTGSLRLVFGFYEGETPPQPGLPDPAIYAEEQTVAVQNGVFNVLIGNGTVLEGDFADIPNHNPLFLQTSVIEEGGNTPVRLLPRHRIASVVYALRAGGVSDGQGDIAARVAALEELLAHFSRNGDNIYITGVNVHIRNGEGGTDTTNGKGNLIVGYNEARAGGITPRTGSHNIVVGARHSYTSYGGLVVGDDHSITGTYASVTGGYNNTASGDFSSIMGGSENTATDSFGSVSGGYKNSATENYASVSGGSLNEASGRYACVSGGTRNVAGNWYSAVSGGDHNTASGDNASVSGGSHNTASGGRASISGGRYNTASGAYSFAAGGGGPDPELDGNTAFAGYAVAIGGNRNLAGDAGLADHGLGQGSIAAGGYTNRATASYACVSGGHDNTASSSYASVSGGHSNTASGDSSSVSGGDNNAASGDSSSVSGGCENTAEGHASSVSAGYNNTAIGRYSSVSGGGSCFSLNLLSSVSGGEANYAAGERSSISGGKDNAATGDWASVSGGQENAAGGNLSSVSGGTRNRANGGASSVSGGQDKEIGASYQWRAGDIWTNSAYEFPVCTEIEILGPGAGQ